VSISGAIIPGTTYVKEPIEALIMATRLLCTKVRSIVGVAMDFGVHIAC